MRARIYIAGPYSSDHANGVREALAAANKLADLGFAPYIPHLTHFWDLLYPRPYEYWMALDFEYVKVCNGLLRLPGDSKGADREVELALESNIPVFYSIEQLVKHFAC